MTFKTNISHCLRFGLALMACCCASWSYADDESTQRVSSLMATFNEDEIPFNDRLITLGKADAPINAVFIFGLTGDTSFLVKTMLPDIMKKYVDSGRMKLTIIEQPLTWHDMQAFAGFRCVAAEKHWELLLRVAKRDVRQAFYMKGADYLKAPEYIWPMMKDFDVSREQAEKCMRNSAIVGHMEGQRRVVNETWHVTTVPTFIIGEKILVNPASFGIFEDAVESALKGSKP
ncbi:MAG: thioredoxin domain-containing protein [Pseudomonadota bacterium]